MRPLPVGPHYSAQIVKLVCTFRRPADPQVWMSRYLTEHEPLCRELDGLIRLELSSPFAAVPLSGQRGDRRGPPFLVSELYFADRAAFDAAMTTDRGRAMLASLETIGGDGAAMWLADVEPGDGPRFDRG